jgi:hypothetical protein
LSTQGDIRLARPAIYLIALTRFSISAAIVEAQVLVSESQATLAIPHSSYARAQQCLCESCGAVIHCPTTVTTAL